LPKLRQADGSRQIDKAISFLTAVALPVITHTSAPKSGYPYSAPILSLKAGEINGRQARSIR
jgi:hypothetical protein